MMKLRALRRALGKTYYNTNSYIYFTKPFHSLSFKGLPFKIGTDDCDLNLLTLRN